MDDNLLETIQRVIDRRRSKTCEDKMLKENPRICPRRPFASSQKLRNHVWDIEKDKGCLICNSDVMFVIALLLRSLATSKHRN